MYNEFHQKDDHNNGTHTRPAKDRVSMKDHSSDYTPPQNNGGVTCNNKKLTDIIVELINFLGGKNVRRI